MSDYNLLDVRYIDEFIDKKDAFISKYNELNKRYDKIISQLLEHWKGYGAESFEEDTKKVKENITGIEETLKVMCDTLQDCKSIFEETDKKLKTINEDAFQNEK